MPSGPIPPNPSELLNSHRFTQMAQSLLEHGYDHVVFDSPPVLAVSDAVIIASTVEAAILVVRARQTPRHAARAAADKLRQSGKGAAGVVLNDLEMQLEVSSHRRYYGYARPEQGEEAPETTDTGRKRAAGLGA
jgi:capsular exopolysaccharide synthesis family protein